MPLIGYVEVYNSDHTLESTYKYVPDLDTTTIKSTDYDEMDQILELFHAGNDDDLLGVDLHILEA